MVQDTGKRYGSADSATRLPPPDPTLADGAKLKGPIGPPVPHGSSRVVPDSGGQEGWEKRQREKRAREDRARGSADTKEHYAEVVAKNTDVIPGEWDLTNDDHMDQLAARVMTRVLLARVKARRQGPS